LYLQAVADNEGFLEEAEKLILDLSRRRVKDGFSFIRDVLLETFEKIEYLYANKGNITGVPTFFTELDRMTCGWQSSDLVILAARPSMGKTAMVLNMAQNAAVRAKVPVAIFSLEMSKEQLMARVLSSVSRVDSSRLRKGDLSDEEQDRLMEGARRIFEHKSYMGIDETPGITLMELRSRCRRYHKEFGLDMVLIDYLQLMSGGSTNKNESRERDHREDRRGTRRLRLGPPLRGSPT